MTDDDRDLAASGALGALAADEAARLEDELSRNAELAAEHEDYRTTVSMIESAVARERPPADLFEGVLARIEGEREAVAPIGTEPTSPRRWSLTGRSRRLLPAFAAGVAAAAAVVVVALALSSDGGLGTPDARATVQGTPEFSGVHGEARIYAASSEDGTLVLDMADVPQPGSGEHYEIWVLRESAGGEMEAVGVFTPESTDVNLELRLPGPGDYKAVDVSVQPNGGPAEHSGRSLAGGRFEPSST